MRGYKEYNTNCSWFWEINFLRCLWVLWKWAKSFVLELFCGSRPFSNQSQLTALKVLNEKAAGLRAGRAGHCDQLFWMTMMMRVIELTVMMLMMKNSQIATIAISLLEPASSPQWTPHCFKNSRQKSTLSTVWRSLWAKIISRYLSFSPFYPS